MAAPETSQTPTPAARQRSRMQDMVRSLRHPNFQYFFGGQFISLIGTWMDQIAELWLVYRLTNSPLLLGIAGFASQIPVFLLAPLGGVVADRLNRHRVVITTQSLSMVLAGILTFLTLTKRVTVIDVITLAALMGCVNAFDIPARQAFLVDMVGREDLMNAIALNSSMFNGARFVGPAIAGILVASIGEGWCFFANAVSYIAVIAGLLLMKIERRNAVHRAGSPIEHIAEGFRFVRNTAPIRAILLLLGLGSLVGMPYTVLMPVFATKILHGNARTLGVLMGATGIGAVMGALLLASRTQLRGLSRFIFFSCAGFGASLILFSFSRWYLLSVALLVPVGFCMMVQMASSNTLIQAMVPDELRGRTMAVYSMMFMGMAPLGALLAGGAAERIGAPSTVAAGGAIAIVGALLFGRHLPKIRVEARQLILAQGMAAGEPAQELNTPAVT